MKQPRSNEPRFLNDISIGNKTENKKADPLPVAPKSTEEPKIVFVPGLNIEYGTPIQFRYAIKMNVEVEKLANSDLYKFIESWWGTPYRLGGSTKKGIDCSAFTPTLFSSIYNLQVPRTANEQSVQSASIKKNELKEGDLVFFNTTRRHGVTHVGVYLHDDKFVHASSSSGVIISSLNEGYWSKRFLGAGRVVDEVTIDNISLSSH